MSTPTGAGIASLDAFTCERIAKRWCELIGVDPYEMVQHGADPDPNTGYVPAICLSSPRWYRVAREVPEQLAWMKAIREFIP